MAETEVVVPGDRIDYTGVFSVPELYRLIDGWLLDKGYYRIEPKHVESAKPEGKFVDLELTPGKELTDYAKSALKIRIQLNGIKEVSIEGPDGKQKYNQGNVHIVLSGILETDYQGKWETKPMYQFVRFFYDKYIYKSLTGGFQGTIRGDVADLKNRLFSFLNLHRYTT